MRHVGRLLDGQGTSRPAELVLDGDLVLLIERMLCLLGLDTVRISKVKGHADEALVRTGWFRDRDRLGYNGADEAADFGRRGCLGGLLMLGAIILGSVLVRAACCQPASVFFLAIVRWLLSIIMVWLVLLWTLWFGLWVVSPRGVELCMLFVIGPSFLGFLESGM